MIDTVIVDSAVKRLRRGIRYTRNSYLFNRVLVCYRALSACAQITLRRALRVDSSERIMDLYTIFKLVDSGYKYERCSILNCTNMTLSFIKFKPLCKEHLYYADIHWLYKKIQHSAESSMLRVNAEKRGARSTLYMQYAMVAGLRQFASYGYGVDEGHQDYLNQMLKCRSLYDLAEEGFEDAGFAGNYPTVDQLHYDCGNLFDCKWCGKTRIVRTKGAQIDGQIMCRDCTICAVCKKAEYKRIYVDEEDGINDDAGNAVYGYFYQCQNEDCMSLSR